jgi:NhaP-type Na+/H+ or K+/H+ antiporter
LDQIDEYTRQCLAIHVARRIRARDAIDVFAVIVLNEQLPGDSIIMSTAACTIVLSVVAHGLSVHPFVSRLVKGAGRTRQ